MGSSEASRFTVYADISCPFCFVLHERLALLNCLEQADWLTIEHAPGANSQLRDPRQIAQLNEEYRLIVKRGSDIRVCNPGFVPNTALANRYLLWVELHHFDQLIAVRTAFYRALWQNGADISEKSVLEGLLKPFGIDKIKMMPSIEDKLSGWQRKWQYADYDLRIPVMQRAENEVMLGLQHIKSIESFINTHAIAAPNDGDICRYIAKDLIMVLSASDSPPFQQLIDDEHSLLYFYQDADGILADVIERPVDVLLLDASLTICIEVVKRVRNIAGPLKHLPIVLYHCGDDRTKESAAFNCGVSDFVTLANQSESLLSRLRYLIRTKHQLDILSDHAAHDGLTGLYNKREFENCLEREWRLACRLKRHLGILLLDIDYFKTYNDHYGHLAGDEALIKVASCVAGSVYRGTDLPARYGGEEFVVILPNSDENSLNIVAQRIRAAVAELNIEHIHNKASHCLTVSIGLALTLADADNNYLMLVEQADQCLYQAKSQGRNGVCFDMLEGPEY